MVNQLTADVCIKGKRCCLSDFERPDSATWSCVKRGDYIHFRGSHLDCSSINAVQISEVSLFITLVYLLYFKALVQSVVLKAMHSQDHFSCFVPENIISLLELKKKNVMAAIEFKVWVVFCMCCCESVSDDAYIITVVYTC